MPSHALPSLALGFPQRRRWLTNVLLVAIAASMVVTGLIAISPTASAQTTAETSLHVLAPYGDAPDRIADGTPNDTSLLHQISIEVRDPANGDALEQVIHSGTREGAKLKFDRSREAYRLQYDTEDLGLAADDRRTLVIRVAGLVIGQVEVASTTDDERDDEDDDDDDDERDDEAWDDEVTVRFRVEPSPVLHARVLADRRVTIVEAWTDLRDTFDWMSDDDVYAVLRDDLRRGDTVTPYRDTFGTRQDKCRTFAFTYTNDHTDEGTWCDSDKDVTRAGFPGLHAESLRLDCKEHFSNGQPSKGKSDLAGLTVAEWRIDNLDKPRKSCEGSSGITIVPEAPQKDRTEPYSVDDLAWALTELAGATPDRIAGLMRPDFGPLEALQAIVRAAPDTGAATVIDLAVTHWGLTDAQAAEVLGQITLADGTSPFAAVDLVAAQVAEQGVDGALDGLASPAGLDAQDAIRALALAGITVDAALAESIRATSYDIAALVAAIEAIYGGIADADWTAARQAAIDDACAAGFDDEAGLAEAARLIGRAHHGASSAERAGLADAMASCGATAEAFANLLGLAFPDLGIDELAAQLTSPPFELRGPGGVADVLMSRFGYTPAQVASTLIDRAVPREEALGIVWQLTGRLLDLTDAAAQTAPGPVTLPEQAELLLEVVTDPANQPASGTPTPDPLDVIESVVNSGGLTGPPPGACDVVLAAQRLNTAPVDTITGSHMGRLFPQLFTASQMRALATCLADNGVDFPIPVRTISAELTSYLPPQTSLPVPKGVVSGHLSVDFAGLSGTPLPALSLPTTVAEASDHHWYDGSAGCCSAKYGYAPADRQPAAVGPATQAFGLGGPLRVVVPDLPDSLPQPTVRMHAGFYTDPRLGCSYESPAAGMAAVAEFPAGQYPNQPLPWREMDQMAFGDTTRTLDQLTTPQDVRIPQYATTPAPGINACSRITHNDPRLHANMHIRVDQGVAVDAPSSINVPFASHQGRQWGLGLVTAQIPLSGPDLLLLLVDNNVLPADGPALGQYLRTGV